MKRALSLRTWALATALAAVVPAVAAAQSGAKPVVAVLYFDNNSIGKDRADYDGLGKGIADLLITDLAGNQSLTVVEREKVQALLQEQSLTKAGAIDAETAVKLGKLLGAQYMVTGGFLSTGRGDMVLTARSITVETGVISNPQRVQAKGDDVLGLIAMLSARMQKDMKLPAMRVGDASGAQQEMKHEEMKHDDGMKHDAAMKHEEAKQAPAKQEGAAATKQAGEPAKQAAAPAKQSAPAAKPMKLDVRTALLYSKALEEQDQGNNTKAAELYRAVLAKFPDFAPAKNGYARVSKGA